MNKITFNKKLNKIIKNLLTIFIFCIITTTIYTEEFNIKKIEINGLDYRAKLSFTRYIVKNFNLISTTKLMEDIMNLKRFSKINLKISHEKLILTLEEYPIIESIKVYGDETPYLLEILRASKIENKKEFMPINLQIFKKKIKNTYNRSAFFNFDLKINLNLNKKTNKIKININFKKNDRFSIKKIFAYGINTKHGKEIIEGFIARNTSWFSMFDKKDIYAKQIMDRELQFVKDNYLFNGHLDFYIKSGKLIINKNKSEIVMLLDIHEGRQYKIRKNIIKKDLEENEFDSEVIKLMDESFKENSTFDSNEASMLQRKIEMYFHYKGFLEVKPEIEPIMAGEDLVDLELTFKKTKRPLISSIDIKNNKKINDFLLRTLTKQMEQSYGNGLYIDFVKRDLKKFTHATELKYSIEKYQHRTLKG